MLENTLTVANQVGILFALIGIGFICNKAKLISKIGAENIVNLLLLIVTPCVIINSFNGQLFSSTRLANLTWAFVLSFSSVALGILACRFFVNSRDINSRSVLRSSIVFSNANFMALPLQQALLGSDGVFYGVAYVVVFYVMFWSWGLITFCGSVKEIKLRTLFINPGTIGITLGLPFFLFSFSLPPILSAPISSLAALNTPLAMIIIGFNLANAKLNAVAKDLRMYFVVILRLIVLPACFILLAWLLTRFGITFDTTMIIAITAAASAPCAAMTSMFAVRYNRNIELAVGLITITTLLSIITMPLLVGFSLWFFAK